MKVSPSEIAVDLSALASVLISLLTSSASTLKPGSSNVLPLSLLYVCALDLASLSSSSPPVAGFSGLSSEYRFTPKSHVAIPTRFVSFYPENVIATATLSTKPSAARRGSVLFLDTAPALL